MGPSDHPAGAPAEFYGGSSEIPTLTEKSHSSRLEFGEEIPAGWNAEESTLTPRVSGGPVQDIVGTTKAEPYAHESPVTAHGEV